MDPKAEKYFSISPYAYCNNNPVIFVDPDGKVVRLAGKKELEMIRNTVRRNERPFIVANENGEIDFNSMRAFFLAVFICFVSIVNNVSVMEDLQLIDEKEHVGINIQNKG